MKARVLLSDYEETYCEHCGTTIECDENGEMPDICPHCKAELDYFIFERKEWSI